MAIVNGFRVICDLSEFLSGFRSKSMLYVDFSKDSYVADLAARIRILLGLQPSANLLLIVNGCVLPETENVRVLQQEDILKVFNDDKPSASEPVKDNSLDLKKYNHKQKKQKPKRKVNWEKDESLDNKSGFPEDEKNYSFLETSIQGDNEVVKVESVIMQNERIANGDKILLSTGCMKGSNLDVHKEKYQDMQKTKRKLSTVASVYYGNCSNIQQIETKNKTNCHSFTAIQLSNVENSSLLHKPEDVLEGKLSMDKADKLSVIEPELFLPFTIDKVDHENSHSETKRSRKRIRSRRARTQCKENEDNVTNVNKNHKIEIKTGNLLSYSALGTIHNDKLIPNHIRFSGNSDDEYEISHPVNNGNAVLCTSTLPLKESVASTSTSAEVDLAATTCCDLETNSKCVSISNAEYSKDYLLTQDNKFSKLLALATFSTPLVVKRGKPSTLVKETNSAALAETAVPFQGLPKSGDILKFKILRLDNNYCPQLSEPITAEVIQYLEGIGEVVVNILVGNDQCRQPTGKFDLEAEGIELKDELPSTMKFSWSDMLEPQWIVK